MSESEPRIVRWPALLLWLFGSAAGCGGEVGQGAAEAAAESRSELTAEVLGNAVYLMDLVDDGQVRLVDGRFQDTARRVQTAMLPTYAVGDLDGDGAADAAVVLATNTGGSGTFEHLAAVLNRDGGPVNIASLYLGDRFQVERVAIEDGEILLEMVVHGPNDAMCCPSVPAERRYRLGGGQLVEVER